MDIALSLTLNPSPGMSALPTSVSTQIGGRVLSPINVRELTCMMHLPETPREPIHIVMIKLAHQDLRNQHLPSQTLLFMRRRLDWWRRQRSQSIMMFQCKV